MVVGADVRIVELGTGHQEVGQTIAVEVNTAGDETAEAIPSRPGKQQELLVAMRRPDLDVEEIRQTAIAPCNRIVRVTVAVEVADAFEGVGAKGDWSSVQDRPVGARKDAQRRGVDRRRVEETTRQHILVRVVIEVTKRESTGVVVDGGSHLPEELLRRHEAGEEGKGDKTSCHWIL